MNLPNKFTLWLVSHFACVKLSTQYSWFTIFLFTYGTWRINYNSSSYLCLLNLYHYILPINRWGTTQNIWNGIIRLGKASLKGKKILLPYSTTSTLSTVGICLLTHILWHLDLFLTFMAKSEISSGWSFSQKMSLDMLITDWHLVTLLL